MNRLLRILVAAALILGAGLASTASAQTVDDGVLTYEVQAGDTLFGLAEQYFRRTSDYQTVQRLNRVRDPYRMPVGLVLRIPVGVLRSAPASARVASFRGDVQIIRVSGAVAPVVGQAVSEGDLIVTGANARIQFELPDGGRVTLPSQTRARLVRLRRFPINGAIEHEVELEDGRVESQAATVRTPGAFRIRTPITVSAVRGTEFRVEHEVDDDASATTVIEGRVGVGGSGDGDALVAGAGQGVIQGAGEAAALVDLLAAPTLDNADAVQTGPSVRLRAAPMAGAERYRLQLATDAGFVETIAEAETPAGQAAEFEGVADGVYFARISAVSPEGLEGLYADYAVIRARNGLRGLEAAPGGAGYLFRWIAEGDGPAAFRFQLRRAEEAGPPLIDEAGLTMSELTLSDLPAGVYEWRVQSLRHRFGRAIETWSEPRRLHIGR